MKTIGLEYVMTQQMVYPTHIFRRLDDSWVFLEIGLVGIISESEATV